MEEEYNHNHGPLDRFMDRIFQVFNVWRGSKTGPGYTYKTPLSHKMSSIYDANDEHEVNAWHPSGFVHPLGHP